MIHIFIFLVRLKTFRESITISVAYLLGSKFSNLELFFLEALQQVLTAFLDPNGNFT